MRAFIDDEDGYAQWIYDAANRTGFVVNCNRTPSPGYLILHRATCRTITSRIGATKQTDQFIKVCANNIGELEEWAICTVGGKLQPCGMCKPERNAIIPADALNAPVRIPPTAPENAALLSSPGDDFSIMCPNAACHAQASYSLDRNDFEHALTCMSCGHDFVLRIAKVRAANSRRDGNLREFSIRLKTLAGKEDLLQFTNFPSHTFDLKSGDLVVFSYVLGQLKLVQNLTVGRWMSVGSPAPLPSGCCVVPVCIGFAGFIAAIVLLART